MASESAHPNFEHPDFGDMTPEQYAQWLEEHETEGSWGLPVETEISANLSSVVSVRFHKGELALVNAAAEEAGVKLSTFIRQLVLAQIAEPDATLRAARTLMQDREAIEAAAQTLSSVVGHLRAVPQLPAPGSTPQEREDKAA
jgi:Family of unknown function (DUF6290)